MNEPVLTTERLVLRPPRGSDFESYAAFFASDRSIVIGGPHQLARAWQLFAADVGHWTLKGYGWFTITRTGDDTPLGIAGLHHPPQHDDVELGWTLYDAALGQGIATEAARAALEWYRSETPEARVVSYIDRANEDSQAVAKRLGATDTGERARHDKDCDVWLHEVPE